MTGTDHEEIQELVKSIHALYQRFGEPDDISFLDGRVRLSWRAASSGLDRYEEIPVDTELLYNTSWSAGSSSEIHIHFNGDVLIITSQGGEVWSRIHDLAEASKEPK